MRRHSSAFLQTSLAAKSEQHLKFLPTRLMLHRHSSKAFFSTTGTALYRDTIEVEDGRMPTWEEIQNAAEFARTMGTIGDRMNPKISHVRIKSKEEQEAERREEERAQRERAEMAQLMADPAAGAPAYYRRVLEIQKELKALPDLLFSTTNILHEDSSEEYFDERQLSPKEMEEVRVKLRALIVELKDQTLFPADDTDVQYLLAELHQRLGDSTASAKILLELLKRDHSFSVVNLYIEACLRANNFAGLPLVLKPFEPGTEAYEEVQGYLFGGLHDTLQQVVTAAIVIENEGLGIKQFVEAISGIGQGLDHELTKKLLWTVYNETNVLLLSTFPFKGETRMPFGPKKRKLFFNIVIIICKGLLAGEFCRFANNPLVLEFNVRALLFSGLVNAERTQEACVAAGAFFDFWDEWGFSPELKNDQEISGQFQTIRFQFARIRGDENIFQGIKLAEKFVVQYQDDLRGYHFLTLLLTKAKRYEDALRVIDKAIERWPDVEVSTLLKTSVLETMGQKAEAVRLAKTTRLSYRRVFAEDKDGGFEMPGEKIDPQVLPALVSASANRFEGVSYTSPFLEGMELSTDEEQEALRLETKDQRNLREHYARYEIAHRYGKLGSENKLHHQTQKKSLFHEKGNRVSDEEAPTEDHLVMPADTGSVRVSQIRGQLKAHQEKEATKPQPTTRLVPKVDASVEESGAGKGEGEVGSESKRPSSEP